MRFLHLLSIILLFLAGPIQALDNTVVSTEDRLVIVTPAGAQVVLTSGGLLNKGGGLTKTCDNRVAVVDLQDGQIIVVSANGTQQLLGTVPNAIDVATLLNCLPLVAATDGKLYTLYQGVANQVASGLGNIRDIAKAGGLDVLVASGSGSNDGGKIWRVTAPAHVFDVWSQSLEVNGGGVFDSPTAIAYDFDNDRIFVIDERICVGTLCPIFGTWEEEQLLVIEPSAMFVAAENQFGVAHGVAVERSGDIMVAEQNTHTLIQYDGETFNSTNLTDNGNLVLPYGAMAFLPDCSDHLNNDKEPAVDMADVGCDSPDDVSEKTNAYECDDGLDNDGDGLIDFTPNNWYLSPTGGDPGCRRADQLTEKSQCTNGLDDDGDGKIDTCKVADWDSSLTCPYVGPAEAEFADPGCLTGGDYFREDAECGDSADNDLDGFVDLADDGCPAPGSLVNAYKWDTEGHEPPLASGNSGGGCGLTGIEPFLLGGWLLRRRRSK